MTPLDDNLEYIRNKVMKDVLPVLRLPVVPVIELTLEKRAKE
jgi:hypothetical protein